MKKITLTSLVILLAVVALAPDTVSAQGLADVCNGPDCSACNIVDLANRLISWLIGIVTVLFAVLMLVAGFGLVTAGGNPSALQAAKSKFVNALIGFMIVLAAWLVVDTLMRGLIGGDGSIEGWGPWSSVQCWDQADVADIPAIDSSAAGTDGSTPPTIGTLGSTTVSPGGTTCFPGANGVIDGPSTFGGDDVCIDSSAVSGGSYNLADGSGLGYTPPSGYFGPDVIAANPQITPNFRLCDVTNCDEARRSGDYIYIDPFMVQQLEGVRNDIGDFQVNSGYRSPAYNAGVGGATHSRHQYGDAVDIAVTRSNTEARILATCLANGATNRYTYDSGAHVHCDWRGAQR